MSDATLALQIDAGANADAEELEGLRIGLRDELMELSVDSVETVPLGKTPADAKAFDVVAAGSLLVTLAPAAIAAVARALHAWAARDARRTVTVQMGGGESITLTGATDSERERLVEAWLARQQQRTTDV